MKTGPKPFSRLDAMNTLFARSIVNDRGCILVVKTKSIGIGYKAIRADGESWYAHRLAYCYYHNIRYLLSDEVVRHSCDNPNCIAKEHLILGTHADNVKDKVEKDRHCYGEKHYASKLTDDEVRFIKRSKLSRNYLAAMFNVSGPTITLIRNGKNWKHIKV